MSLIKKPFELEVNNSIKALIYGQPGLGKTTLSLSAPSPLLFDFDGGVHRVMPIHQTDTIQVRSWNDVVEVLKEDLSGYKTIVIDTAGKMLDFMAADIIKGDPKMARKDGALTLQGYGARKVKFQNFLKQVSLMGKHLVFVAHDKEERDGDYRFIRPEIGGSSGGDLIKEIDLVGYMEAVGKKRTISFDPCEKFYGKNTCHLPTLMELPDVADGAKPNLMLTDIFSKYALSLEERKKVAGEYSQLMEIIRGGIDEAADCDALNEKVKWVQTLQVIWDSKLQASYLIKAKSQELGCVLNKSKIYVAAEAVPAV
jgi:hypothetical protein